MIARPMTTAEVARALQMSVRTVETHLHNVTRKIGTSGRDPLARAITTWLRPAGT
jgi:DNA-binding CsgD family transcriptional regulator